MASTNPLHAPAIKVFVPAGAAVLNGTVVEQELGAAEALELTERLYSEDLRQIADRLEKLAQEQVTAKIPIEERAIAAVRQFHGIYPPGKKFDEGASKAFVRATRAKTVALEARLFDLIFPTDDRNWGISPTPVPKLSAELAEATTRATNAAEQANQAEAAGDEAQAQQIVAAGNDEAGRAAAAESEIAKANKASKLMQEEIDDQLVESHYPAESRKMIHDACLVGTGILKGPMVNERSRGRWMASTADPNTFELKQNEDTRPLVRRVNFWSFFPDMSAASIEEAEFTFERYLWTASDLRKMVKTHGFDPEAVRELLRDDRRDKQAINTSLTNLVQLRSLMDTMAGSGSIKNRYVGWEYHGPLECGEVAAILRWQGREDEALEYEASDDPLREVRVVIHFCEGVILKLADAYPLDSGETLYSVFCIEKAEESIFGYGIPTIISDSQDALNSSWRMALDNGGLSVGPITVVDKDGIEPADGSWVMKAKKIFFRTKAAVPNAPAVEFIDVPNNVQALASIIKVAEMFIDMESGIPQPQQGEQGAHTTQTVGGMAILQNAANIVFRRTVKNYDDGIIAPTMRRFYDWNMQFNPKAELKGDMQVDARGTSVLLLKEVQATNLMLIVTGLMQNPTIAPMLKAYPAVEKLFQAMMIKPDDVLVGQDKYDEAMKKMAEQPPQPSPAEISAQARIQAAEIGAQVSEMKGQLDLQIAQLKERTAMVELATNENLSLEQLRTALATKQLDVDSAERRQITEAALERKMAKEARAEGREPGGSGGNFSMGEEQK